MLTLWKEKKQIPQRVDRSHPSIKDCCRYWNQVQKHMVSTSKLLNYFFCQKADLLQFIYKIED